MNTSFVNENVEMHINNDIIFINHLTENLSLEVAKEIVKQRLKLCYEKNLPLVLDMRKLKSIDKASREYLARPECMEKLWAGAFIVESLFQEITGTLFLNLHKPPIPAKIFKKEKEAIEWIQSLTCKPN
ncbi:MAG: STAS/SEC14 domain-containing protein [Sporocytophaga sp.]|uniref:DUF7793 family protein n=1 Tax=Sporocytophaga sp. TaxID=2231183 RepID=UPI001B138CE7|nr:hypothetical protein [Sporocytophaga sp.]MBO9701428.1 STAS/SEC14 domain-containing protein [Sporocytophaga sp.]